MRKVRDEGHGGIDRVAVIDVPAPEASPGHVVVRVRATCINPGTLPVLDGAPF